MKFSKRSEKLTSSPLYVFFRKVKEAEAAGKKIISLGVGEPFQDTPENIKQAGIEAIKAGKTKYNPAAGSTALRKKMAEKYQVSIEQVVTSNGAKPFLGSIFWSLVDEGEIVYLAAPVYPPFFAIAESCDAKVVLIDTKPTEFKLTLKALKEAVENNDNGKPAHLLVNSPNNPTGVVSDKEELEKIVRFCKENNITLISDECYSQFSPDPSFSLRQIDPKVIVINSFSKAYGMTGWRLGYVVCPAELAVALTRYLDNYVGCASSISDAAAITALDSEPLEDFVEQRKIIHQWLAEHQIPFSPSTGGIFIFPDFKPVIEKLNLSGSMELAAYFLEKAEVATTPGIAFGEAYDTHLRISYSIKIEELKEALEKLDKVMIKN